jgi:hypothetical protein
MRQRAVTAALAVALALRCSPPVDELPEVKTLASLGQPCIEPLQPITLSSVPSLRTTDIGICVQTAWASRCAGSMSFEADVNNVGGVRTIRYTGDASPELRRCIREVLAKPVPVPRAECPANHGTTTLSGGIKWPENGGTFIHLAGDSAVIACLRECSEGAGGPTRGCT